MRYFFCGEGSLWGIISELRSVVYIRVRVCRGGYSIEYSEGAVWGDVVVVSSLSKERF